MQTGKDNIYLVELDYERERIAVRRAFAVHFLLAPLIEDLGISWPLYWAVLELPKAVYGESKGDFDVLLGKLVVGQDGFVIWPPSDDRLAAIEVKVSYPSLKAGHGKRRKIENQLKSLVQLGINRIALLDIIVTEPSSSAFSGQAWMQASVKAIEGLKSSMPLLQNRPLPNPFIGHWAWSWGSVAGGVEYMRGVGAPLPLRHGAENDGSSDPQMVARRLILINHVSGMLASRPIPQYAPYVATYCNNCLSLHRLDSQANVEPCLHVGNG